MDLRQLRYFVAVAEDLHFGHAAARLHIAQPALSIQIKALEEMLGVQLLARTNRVVTLTEAGRLFLTEARQTLQQAERASDVARRASRGELGYIGIGFTAPVAYSGVLSAKLGYFRRQAPDVQLGLHERHSYDLIDWLLNDRIQVGFVSTLGAPLPKELVGIRVAEWPFHLALPADHPLTALAEIPIDALADEAFILFSRADEEQGRALALKLLGFEPKIAYEATSAISVVSLVGAGLGIALLPASVASLSMGNRVTYRPLLGLTSHITVDVAARRDTTNAAVRRFLCAMQEEGE